MFCFFLCDTGMHAGSKQEGIRFSILGLSGSAHLVGRWPRRVTCMWSLVYLICIECLFCARASLQSYSPQELSPEWPRETVSKYVIYPGNRCSEEKWGQAE